MSDDMATRPTLAEHDVGPCFEARVAGVVHPDPALRLFVDLLRAARSPLDARALKLRLTELGHDKVATDVVCGGPNPSCGATVTWCSTGPAAHTPGATPRLRLAYQGVQRVRDARDRQIRADAMRALAEREISLRTDGWPVIQDPDRTPLSLRRGP